MSASPLTARIAAPYARALFDFSVEKNIMHQITADFQNLDIFFSETSELTEYLNSPVVSEEAKRELLAKTVESKINIQTFKFLMILVNRDRIFLYNAIANYYLKLVYELASLITVEVITTIPFTESQKSALEVKLKELTNASGIELAITVDSSLIGGFLIKTDSKIIDFTIKNQLKKLAKHLDTILEI